MAGDINLIQDEMISEFVLLDGDKEMTVVYLMELGQRLPDLVETERTDLNLVKGCQSKVWLTAHMENGRVIFAADSNTAITKGLVSLLIRVFSDQTPETILDSDLYFIQRIGMEGFIGTQRSSGFAAMILQMKRFALAFKLQFQAQ